VIAVTHDVDAGAYFSRMVQRTPSNDDPTSEEAALLFDGTQTDPLDDAYRLRVVTASEGGNGGIGFDDRGQARWQWKTESEIGGGATGTFNELKALENPALALQGETPSQPEPSKTTGYDPYASGVFVKPKIER
jgi:hypothetical protein